MSTDRNTKLMANVPDGSFGLYNNKSQATMRMTTQQGLKSPVFNISINYRAYRMFQTKYLNSKFVKDTLFSPNNLIR